MTPRLIEIAHPRDPEGLVLVLHGGASRPGSPMVSPTQLSVLRMVPIARRVARAGRGRLAVFRLLNSVRGWDSRHTPVDDVRWALRRLGERFSELPPTGLVGHSLGGRAALLAGDAPSVRSVVALNPWLHPSDSATLAGREVLIVHGSADRIADPDRSAALARRLTRTANVSYVRVAGGKHAMLRRHATFDSLAGDFTVNALLHPGTGLVGEPEESWRQV
ncbi:alpha/beta hydrolase [Pseudonocardia saturnea]